MQTQIDAGLETETATESRTIGPSDAPYALIFRPGSRPGTRFLTPAAMDLQVGIIERARGERVQPHMHPGRPRQITSMGELLYVESGRIEIEIHDEEWTCCAREIIDAGSMILLLRGGHAMNVVADARVIEVRIGPYAGADIDKRFAPAA
jgi:hypothetical protein